MHRHLKRTLVFFLGTCFIILGLVGLVLPILQGWLFLLIGLLLFSIYSPRLREWIDYYTKPYPKIHAMVSKAESWVARMFGA